MARIRNDYTIRKNRQYQRSQKNLWDVVVAKSILVTTAQSEEAAKIIADALNKDPYALNKLYYVNKKSLAKEQ